MKNTIKMTAAALAVLTAVMTPTVFLGENKVFAAEAPQKKYIKNIRIFSKTHADKDDAEKWCDSLPENKDSDPSNDWAVWSDNLDKGAAGALKKSVGVYLCYQTTTNPKEAVRDLAVMNEQGNYSEGAYERILEEQRDMYADLVSDTKTMIEEYRVNYANGLPTAVQAHDFMNTYREDDSQKLFGDFMLTVSDEDLTEVLLQANGQAVLMMQEQLASACDTGKSTWLDRMAQLGSYETLRKQALKACNNDAKKADKALNQKYQETAKSLAENWDDIYQHFKKVETYAKENGLDQLSPEEYTAFISEKKIEAEKEQLDAKTYVFLQEQEVLIMLAAYEYDGATLYEYFNRPPEAVSGDNLKALYPLAASLSAGQLSGLNETVSLFTLLMNAQNATVINPYKKGMAAQLTNAGADTQKEAEQMKAEQQKTFQEWKSIEPISIYEGIDRGVYGGGVAVTSSAKTFADSKGASWTDSFVESGALIGTSIGLAVGSALFAVGSAICAKYVNDISFRLIEQVRASVASFRNEFPSLMVEGVSNDTMFILEHFPTRNIIHGKNGIANAFSNYMEGWEFKKVSELTSSELKEASEELISKAFSDQDIMAYTRGAGSYKMLKCLEVGMAVVAVILAAADIVLTVVELYKYYHRDHLPIPKYMVDLSYNEDKETSFIPYRGVLDQDGDQGDLNGGSGKQWLALYASYDEDAGDPILAPDGDFHKGVTQRGKSKTPSGYSPLHFFGTPNAPQNLTFANGENGWSYNDDEGGTYFFFERDKDWNTADAATAMSFGTVALIGGAGALLGFLLGAIVIALYFQRKRKTTE